MNTTPTLSEFDLATRKQAEASDTSGHRITYANAGSGKTKVLVDRVIRLLLLHGVRPERILCITYTEAAATEMANRVTETLADFATLPEADLEQVLRQLLDGTVGRGNPKLAVIRQRARQLMATTLDAPGGLQFITIHAFCRSVLSRFPIEAGLSPRFEMLNEEDSRCLLGEAGDELLDPDGSQWRENRDIQQAVEVLHDNLTGTFWGKWLANVSGRRSLLRDHLRVHQTPEQDAQENLKAVIQNLWEHLGFSGPIPPEALAEEFGRRLVGKNLANWKAMQAALEGHKNLGAQERAVTLKVLLKDIKKLSAGPTAGKAKKGASSTTNRVAAWNALMSELTALFLTKEGRARSKFIPKDLQNAAPDWVKLVDIITEACQAWNQKRLLAITAKATAATYVLCAALDAGYQRIKAAHGKLDFDDLIVKTRELLEDRDSGGMAWFRYRLDQGIEHILIDEAQDTSPEQWRIVRKLFDDILADTERYRTLFAVGDLKQSIYSFQGARPERFRRLESELRERLGKHAPEGLLRQADLIGSFRSSLAVLSFVDAVFKPDEFRESLLVSKLLHRTLRPEIAGSVELWPVVCAAPTNNTADRDGGVEAVKPNAALAQALADRLSQLIEEGVSARDILIVLRSRGTLYNEIIHALKSQGVPVAGHDRLKMGHAWPVEDMKALLRFLLQPHDDLNLAVLLKSPFIGMTDEQLEDVAYQRPAPLWEALLASRHNATLGQGTKTVIVEAAVWLRQVRGIARRERPFDAFLRILSLPCPGSSPNASAATRGRGGGDDAWTAFRRRLGLQPIETLHAFLRLVEGHDQSGDGSYQDLLRFVESAEMENRIAFDPRERNEVHVMTVHGAKGLEAPIVVMPDLGEPLKTKGNTPRFVNDPDAEFEGTPENPPFYWLPDVSATEVKPLREVVEKAIASEIREEHRLLYVGLTRAAERLILMGVIPNTRNKRLSTPCNWQIVARGMQTILAQKDSPFVVENHADARGITWPTSFVGRAFINDPEGGTEATVPSGSGTWVKSFSYEPPQKLASADQIKISRQALLWDTSRPELPVDASSESPNLTSFPAFLLRPPPPENPLARPFVPSRDAMKVAMPSPLYGRQDQRFRRGNMVHMLLEHLPVVLSVPPDARQLQARRMVSREMGDSFDEDELATIIQEVIAIIDHPQWGALFGLDAVAEGSITGLVRFTQGNGEAGCGGDEIRSVTGRIDRLVLLPDRALIVDFKSYRKPPAEGNPPHERDIIQLAGYRALVSRATHQKRVDCALLYTSVPCLVAVEASYLDQAGIMPIDPDNSPITVR